MAYDYQERYNERAAYLAEVRQRKAIVAGRLDFDFEKQQSPELRGTYKGQALIDRWRRECFGPNYLHKLEYEVDDLAELVAWQKADDERFRRRNGLPPSREARRAAIEAKRTARAVAEDEPPSLPDTSDADEATAAAESQPAKPLQRDEITLFGSTRPIQQTVPLQEKKKND
jgi:hypothetical protein